MIMEHLFNRDGTQPPAGAVIHQGERPYWMHTRPCNRCGGAGRSEKWAYTGLVCYDCGGSGKGGMFEALLYTQAELDKLNATAEKRRATAKRKADAAQALREAAANALRAEFEATHADLLAWLRSAVEASGEEDGFLPNMLRLADTRAAWSEAQVAAIAKVKAARDAAAVKRAASAHVGDVGQRLTFDATVQHVHTFSRPCFNASWKTETVCIATLRDAAGNALVVKGTSFWPTKGDTLKLKGTIKEHSDYRGEAQTVLARVAVI